MSLPDKSSLETLISSLDRQGKYSLLQWLRGEVYKLDAQLLIYHLVEKHGYSANKISRILDTSRQNFSNKYRVKRDDNR